MTVIEERNSQGRVRRCDAKCHDAKNWPSSKPWCRCICGGMLHGKRSGSAALREAVDGLQARWFDRLMAANDPGRGQRRLF